MARKPVTLVSLSLSIYIYICTMYIYVCVLKFRILHSTKDDNLSPFDSKIACLCQSIKTKNNRLVYHQRQVRKPIGCEVKWAECSFVIGTGCSVQVLWDERVQGGYLKLTAALFYCMYMLTQMFTKQFSESKYGVYGG